MELPQAGEKQLHIVRDLGHGADGGAGGAHRVFAVYGNSRRDTFNPVHHRPVHTIHELARVWREGLHIPALAFSIECVKCQGRLA